MVLLGIPLARLALGEASIPSVSLVLVFNALTLWTLVTISVEWAKHAQFSLKAVAATARGVSTNPLILGIIGGTLFAYTGLPLPGIVDQTLGLVGQAAAPLSLIVLGMGPQPFRHPRRFARKLRDLRLQAPRCFRSSSMACACCSDLPTLETRVVVMLASLPTGTNVYLMSRQFNTLGSAVAGSLVLSTAIAALTTPLVLMLTGAAPMTR